MITYTTILEMANALGEDAIVFDTPNHISIDFNDFEGFDANWSEIMRDYDNPVAVKAFEDFLNENALSVDDDFYTDYHFNGFTVTVGYTSYDI